MKFLRIVLLTTVVALFAVSCSDGNVFELSVGDCFQEIGATEITDVEMVDCGDPHNHEVISVWNVTEASLPADSAFEEGCYDRFEAAIGTPYSESAIFVTPIYPSPQSWDQGDREVICYSYEFEESGALAMVTGSVLNSGR